jgi:hypothetical protein
MEPLKTPEQHCLAWAMMAKDKIFRSQDAAELLEDDDIGRRVRKLLDCARADLEQLDRLLR